MDAVITYVNGLDPVWQASYEARIGKKILDKRFRDWGTLRYLLRGIDTYMKYVDKVFLIVSGRTQVPEWVDERNLRVVLHEDILPSAYLPLFNCNPLEMYLHRIEGLSEEFIYFNDDFFPLAESSADDFFRKGKAVMSPSRHLLHLDMYKKICWNSDRLARKAAGAPAGLMFLRPQHICAPMLRSSSEKLFQMCRKEIDQTAARPLRTEKDLNQYLYTDYMFLTGQTVPGRLSNRHFSLAAASIDKICAFVENPDRQFACINDVHLSQEKFEAFRQKLLASFEKRLPVRSRFEK